MRFELLGDRILVEEIVNQKRETESGLLIPVSMDDKMKRGIVVVAGPGGGDEGKELFAEVGDEIFYSKYSYSPYRHGSNTYALLRQSAIEGKLKKDDRK